MAVEAPTNKPKTKRATRPAVDVTEEADAPQPGEQLMMLDLDNPEDKALIAEVKKLKKIIAERAEVLEDSKATYDAQQEVVIGKMHERGYTAFRYDGQEFRIISRERIKMKAAKDDEGSDDESEE